MVKLGLLGAGRIGKLHAENIGRLLPPESLGAVYDAMAARAQALAGSMGGVKLVPTPEALIDDPEIDALLVCAPTDTHEALIERAIDRRKAVFCEKPLTGAPAASQRLSQRADAAGVLLQVGFNRRFDPSFQAVREAVSSGALGEVRMLRITSRDPEPPPPEIAARSGGIFMDMAIHDFDMARFLTGQEVLRVQAVGRCLVDPRIADAGDVDSAIVTLEFSEGALGVIELCRAAAYGYDQRVEVLGARGMSAASNLRENTAEFWSEAGVRSARPPHFFLERYRAAYEAELMDFVATLAQGGPPSVSGADAHAAEAIAVAAQTALQESRPVAL